MGCERCSVCGKEIQPLPYVCKYCGKCFCVEHRLPEKHGCEMIGKVRERSTYRLEELIEEISEFEKASKERRRKGLLGKLKEKFKL